MVDFYVHDSLHWQKPAEIKQRIWLQARTNPAPGGALNDALGATGQLGFAVFPPTEWPPQLIAAGQALAVRVLGEKIAIARELIYRLVHARGLASSAMSIEGHMEGST